VGLFLACAHSLCSLLASLLAMAFNGAADQMLLEKEQERPVTFAEALTNTAVRNAILENVQQAVALSPSAAEKIGVHLVGVTLSLCAGAANAIAFAKFGTYVSHVSGVATAIGLRMEAEQDGDVPSVAEIVFYFICGSVLAGLLLPSTTLKMGQARYETVLFLVAGMELVCWWHELRYPQMLAAAMGLQNAMVTSWSGAVLRTTHMTGTATDLGSALGRILSRFFRRGCRITNYSDQDWDDHTIDRSKFVLMNCLLASFIAGGISGAFAYRTMKLHALLVPAGLTTTLAILHTAYCILKWEPLAEAKAAEEMFARQLSGGGSVGEGPWESGGMVAELEEGTGTKAERVEHFIRQISGTSNPADRVEQSNFQISGSSIIGDSSKLTTASPTGQPTPSSGPDPSPSPSSAPSASPSTSRPQPLWRRMEHFMRQMGMGSRSAMQPIPEDN